MKPSDLRRGTILSRDGTPIPTPKRAVRIAVCIPSLGGIWTSHTGVSIVSLVSEAVLAGMGIMVFTENNSVITQARNKLVRLAQQVEADFALWIDADMKFPANALPRLLSHGKDVACAFYNQRLPPYRTIGHLKGPPIDATKGGLHEADYAGMGLMLTKMDVFKKLSAPWFFESYEEKHKTAQNPDGMIGEDSNFCRKITAAGIRMYADLDLTFEMGHVGANVITCLKPPPEPQPSSPSPAAQAAMTT